MMPTQGDLADWLPALPSLVSVHMMILLSLSELIVDIMVSDLQSTVSGSVFKW